MVNLGKIELILRKKNMNQVVSLREKKKSYFGVVNLMRGTKEFKEKERIT